jgi:uncharacterized protein YjbJ (UPF0337 family)
LPRKDQLKGRAAVVLGTIYFMVGKLTGNLKLQAKGKAYQIAGKPLAKYGDAREDAKDAMPRIGL